MLKLELDGLGVRDINNAQAVILFNIGRAEMTVGALTLRGYYLGSDVSHNVKKLVETGYLAQERSKFDRRSTKVRVTEEGIKLRDQLRRMHQRHIEMMERDVTAEELHAAIVTLGRLDGLWTSVPDIRAVAD